MRYWRTAWRVGVLAACVATAGCAGLYGHALRDVDTAFQHGRPDEALARLEAIGGGLRNEALYHAHRGVLLQAEGDIPGSIAAFEAAKPLLRYQEATSITETAGQLTLAEGTTSYQLRPFERLQLHVLQALNHLQLDDWDAARVEVLQIDLLLRRQFDGAAPNGGDALARYLSGIVFEGLGEDSDALIAYRKALQAYDRNGTVTRVPSDLERRLLLLTERLDLAEEHAALAKRFGEQRVREAEALAAGAAGEVIVVAGLGLVPRREEISTLHQDITSGKVYRLSLPALRNRYGGAHRVALLEGDRRLASSEPVEDLAAVAQRTLDDEMPGLIARAIARNVVKNRVANEAGEENRGLEFLVNFASAVLENADVRSWSTLPERFHLVRAGLPPGEHSLVAAFEGAGGGTTRVQDLGVVEVTPRRPVVRVVYHTGY